MVFIQNIGGGFLILFLISIFYFIFWVYCLVDVLRSEFKDPNMKLIWVLILIFAQGIGPIIYILIGSNGKKYSF
ncbi:PLDc_N domain-containing protein [Algoriphagus kandeliae]|uniref:PLDc_N domain-containing protein n=1 Tax=Algoriphagus kandeliae TaxID=2562278 RepID=A0A4Y9QXL8_9BACT|nr:PLDc N-terminal domain-containing protein [Algoriphagus kandeliae]TFV95946.1 PLDc_N domain-containing protein [Algoriphagus kandeliae]